MKNASIIVATHNRSGLLKRVLNALLTQSFSAKYEIIVVNDGSTDNTASVLSGFDDVKKINLEKCVGPATARNTAMKEARYSVIVVMDDDCIPERDWLKNLVGGFGKNVGVVSSFGIHGKVYGGTSTAYLLKAVRGAGYFDEIFPFEYREDTDLVFRIRDMGYDTKYVPEAKFKHVHEGPKNVIAKLGYVLRRIWLHQVDSLLFKRHPVRTKEFLDIRYGFMRNPIKDFQVATGVWRGGFGLSSPQGISFIENKGPLHTLLIVFGGLGYVFAVKLSRLYGSVKYRKLLV